MAACINDEDWSEIMRVANKLPEMIHKGDKDAHSSAVYLLGKLRANAVFVTENRFLVRF